MARILSGKEVVQAMAPGLKERVQGCVEAGAQPTLAILRVGENPSDLSYERTACKRAEALGVGIRSIVLPANATNEQLLDAIAQLNADESIHGCLMFRPLPAGLDEAAACAALDARKDIDGISPASLARVFTGAGYGFPPATAQACMHVLDHYGVQLPGARVVVVGRSLVIGKPVAMMLLARNATVTMCHSRTEDLAARCREADVVICATGRAKAFGAECFAPGQTVIDVGINFDEAGNLCGDVDFDAAEPVVGAITPVPGGIGTVTTSTTMEHVIHSCESALGIA